MDKENFIWVTAECEGFHSYEKAPSEVEFLKHRHRHIFKVKVWIEIFHDDRELEFIMFKRFVEQQIKAIFFKFDGSCEQYSDVLYKEIEDKYSKRDIKISISEDGENGSEITYPKPKV